MRVKISLTCIAHYREGGCSDDREHSRPPGPGTPGTRPPSHSWDQLRQGSPPGSTEVTEAKLNYEKLPITFRNVPYVT